MVSKEAELQLSSARASRVLGEISNGERLQLRREVAVKLWIEETLDAKLPNNFVKALLDGVLLCRLMQAINPSLVPEMHSDVAASPEQTHSFFKMKENIFFFLEAHRELLAGYEEYVTFTVTDLFAKEVEVESVVAALECLGRFVEENSGSLSFTGPALRSLDDVDDAALAEHGRLDARAQQPSSHRDTLVPSNSFSSLSLSLSPARRRRTHSHSRAVPGHVGGLSRLDTDPGVIEQCRLSSSPTISALLDAPLSSLRRSQDAEVDMRQGSYAGNTSPRAPCTSEALLVTTSVTSLHHVHLLEGYKQHEAKVTLLQSAWRRAEAMQRYAKMQKIDASRENVATEILATERTYVSNLCMLKVVFLEPLVNHKLDLLPMTSAILGEIAVISSYGKLLLGKLVDRITSWTPHSRLGDVFLEITDFMKVYTQYVKDYNTITEQLAAARSNESFVEFLASEVGNKPISSLLILPVQRLPRYQMLLESLLKKTSKEHPDYNDLHAALGKMISVASYVNERKKEFERINKVLVLQNKFVGKMESLAAPHRRYVREAEVVMVPEQKPRQLFLCNDILLVAKKQQVRKKDKFRELLRLQLQDISLVDVADTAERENVLDLVQNRKSVFRFSMPDLNSKRKWKASIRSLQEQLNDDHVIKKKSHTRGASVGSTNDQILLEMLKSEAHKLQRGNTRRFIAVGASKEEEAADAPAEVPLICVEGDGEEGEGGALSSSMMSRLGGQSQGRFIDIGQPAAEATVVRSKSANSHLSSLGLDEIPDRSASAEAAPRPSISARKAGHSSTLLSSIDEVRQLKKRFSTLPLGDSTGKKKRDSWRLSLRRKGKRKSSAESLSASHSDDES